MDITTKARILASRPDATLEGLSDFASFLDARNEDLFWIEVRKIRPTLCADW